MNNYESAKIRVETIVGLMSGDVDEALKRLDESSAAWPEGEIVLTYGPFDVPVEEPERSFQNLLAISWQDTDDGSQHTSFIWTRP